MRSDLSLRERWQSDSFRYCCVERQVELQHVNLWLAEQAGETALDLAVDQLLQGIFGELARFGDARDLEACGFRRNVWIEAAAGRGHQVRQRPDRKSTRLNSSHRT